MSPGSMNFIALLFLTLLDFTSSADFSVTILHTNDVHAHFVSFNDKQQPCDEADIAANTCYGGVARRQTALKKLLAEEQNVLKLDAGDQYQGTIWYSALKWAPIAKYMNLMSYDAMTFGNHEFDDGVEGLAPFLKNLSTPVVCCNIVDKGSALKGHYSSNMVKVVGGEKVGIIGVTTKDIPQLSVPGPQLEFRDEIDSLRPVVDNLTAQGINKIIVLSHAGLDVERDICRKVKGVDVVVGGHTHTFLYSGTPPTSDKAEGPYPEAYSNAASKNCLVVQDYAYGKYLGQLKIIFDQAGQVKNWSGNPILIDAKTYPEDREMASLLQPYKSQLEHYQKTEVAVSAVGLDGRRKSCRLKECNLGNIVTDAVVYAYVKRALSQNETDRGPNEERHWTSAAVALWQGGGIRDFETPPGITLTLNDLYSVLPFGQLVEKVTIKGTALREVLEYSVRDYDPLVAEGRFLQVSGLKVVYDLSRPNGHRLREVRIRCNRCGVPRYEPLDNDKMYDVIVNNYLTQGGDGFSIMKNLPSDKAGMSDIEILMDYMKTYQPLLTGEEMRIQFGTSGSSKNRFIWILGAYMMTLLLILD